MGLRIDDSLGRPVLVLPSRRSVAEGLRFAESRAQWLQHSLSRLPPHVAFVDGARVPYLGLPHLVRHRPRARAPVLRHDGEIKVAGQPQHLGRRLTEWFRAEAKRVIGARARRMAERINKTVTRIAIRDGRTRWGSCSPNGSLSFSWRLMLAPPFVLDYVIAHEVAHLVEMNHGPRFWRLVERLCPQQEAAQHWLREHGSGLHRYG
ncbi:MAG: M48 family metallopeptidase [Alphaproteobacteria bacterium]|nr:M48 family metallopeptidase [Alphaproteobacteria bacterium]